MSQFLLDYGLFLAKTLTVVAAVVVIIVVAASASRRSRDGGGLTVKNLNERFREIRDTLRKELLSKDDYKALARENKAARKARAKAGDADRKRLFVLDFHGDIKATGVAGLREEITAVIGVARPEDEVLLRLENYGGLVHEHGLAAAQLARLRDREIALTVAVDKAAASGGYMMACIGNRLIASPFAVVGSIGVLAQIPNFRRLLDEHGVEVEQIKAGRYKRTVTMFGKNTDEDRAKLTEELEDVHLLFRDLIARYRPALDLDRVATGEHWYGTRALELGLVDALQTSDDYLLSASEAADLYAVRWKGRKTITEKVFAAVEGSTDAVLRRLARAAAETRLGSG